LPGIVGIAAKKADVLELKAVFEFCIRERRLKPGARDDLDGVGVEIVDDVLAFFDVAGGLA
jgi:hypothetical protein